MEYGAGRQRKIPMRIKQMCQRKTLDTVMKEHITLYAQWKPKTYTVTFESGDEAIGETMTQEMEYDTSETLDPCNFTKENSIFTHWSRKGGAWKPLLG